MTAQDIKILPTDEKIRIMEAIWEDMREHYEEAPVSQEVMALLRERQARVQSGEVKLLDWDQVKFALGRG
ncbi:MAG: addiction module protein [Terrimicrobiaceae bacterium]